METAVAALRREQILVNSLRPIAPKAPSMNEVYIPSVRTCHKSL
jgi:hypothetical protein